jgi:hypothetical protein
MTHMLLQHCCCCCLLLLLLLAAAAIAAAAAAAAAEAPLCQLWVSHFYAAHGLKVLAEHPEAEQA